MPAARVTGGREWWRTPSEPVEIATSCEIESGTRHYQEGGAVEYRQLMAPVRETRKARESIRHQRRRAHAKATPDESIEVGAGNGGILIDPGRRPRWHEEMLVKECMREGERL